MLARLTVRIALALLCAAGVGMSLIARDSRTTQQEAFYYFFLTKDPRGTVKLLKDSERLNPDFAIEIGKARLQKGKGVQILQEAVEREPENAEVWVRLAQQQAAAGDRAGAARSYGRARELAPLLPPDGPPPGG